MNITSKAISIAALSKLSDNYQQEVNTLVRKTGFFIEGYAKKEIQEQNIIDTGALLNSIFASMKGYDNRLRSQSQSAKRRPGAKNLATQVEHVTVDGKVVVAAPMEYAAHIEYGTVRMPARPFMAPAVKEATEYFETEAKGILDRAARGSIGNGKL